jgi:hypothetical protein
MGVMGLFFALCGSANAVTVETAQQVTRQFEKLTRPTNTSTPFERWAYDTALFTTTYCWRDAHPTAADTDTPNVLHLQPTATGVFTYPEDAEGEKLCESLAQKGIDPVCTHSVLHDITTRPQGDWSREYVQISHDYSRMSIEGELYCYLNDQQVQKQPYMAYLTTEWVEQPRQISIQTATGAKTALSGTILVTDKFAKGLTGKAYSEPRRVIVQE